METLHDEVGFLLRTQISFWHKQQYNQRGIFLEIQTVGEDADFTFEVKEPEYLSLDKASNKVTAMKLGETTVRKPMTKLLVHH